ncbi:hypothetical protein Y032_0393g613 [Ancylostoma ceylanicum]|uniref:Uncharacterized protein n=1 Tax=Ancylostoma ceylanicum TaxID=53326 RepID=A0A016RS38_9BILA|nr:hypothetical protein Y032_0393g613 [Ancylostoma ceylanicum]
MNKSLKEAHYKWHEIPHNVEPVLAFVVVVVVVVVVEEPVPSPASSLSMSLRRVALHCAVMREKLVHASHGEPGANVVVGRKKR